MIPEIDNVKGFRDYLPPESLKREAVKKIIEGTFKLYGFLPVETPIIEYEELMKPTNLPNEEEDEAVSDRFRLKDRAGRNLGLRYEFTFQLARIFKQNPNIKLPFRRYQIGSVFRDEPISSNRFRQFSQCDIDIIGDSEIKADAECLVAFSDILKELKINAEIQVNNRKLINAIIESVQISASKEVMRELDKMTKLGEDLVKTNLRKYADGNKILTLFKLLEKPLDFFIENAFDGAKELQDLRDECSAFGIKVIFNPLMMRGLQYYTGNIFEIVPEENKKSSIAGGGRYDKLVGKYINKEIPAVGISFGLDRLTEFAKIKPTNEPKVILISIDQDFQTAKLLKKFRKSSISSIAFYDKPGKALEYANSYEIPYAVFIGPEEIDKGKFKLRNMKSGEEKYLSEKQLIYQFGKDK